MPPAATLPPRLSLIVATIGREPQLRRLFTSLATEQMQVFEVLLVDQSPAPLTSDIASLATEFSSSLRLRYLRDTGRGLSRARNLALPLARGNYLGFPDDDCWYPGSTVDQVMAFFDKHPDTGILCGIYAEPGRINSSFPADGCRLTPWRCFNRTNSVGLFLNRAAIATAQIVFDERIGAGTELPASEETDLVLRLLLAGAEGHYDPSLHVHHAINRNKAQSCQSFVAMRKAFWYVIGKNHRPFFSEAKLTIGAISCLLKPAPHGPITALRAMLAGYQEGRRVRGLGS